LKVDEFRVRASVLRLDDLPALVTELTGAISSMQAQLEARPRGACDFEWWARARAALGFTVEKRAITRAEILRRQARESHEIICRVLDDIDEQLRMAVDLLDGVTPNVPVAWLAIARARALITAAR
jgi:hypothetical protein